MYLIHNIHFCKKSFHIILILLFIQLIVLIFTLSKVYFVTLILCQYLIELNNFEPCKIIMFRYTSGKSGIK